MIARFKILFLFFLIMGIKLVQAKESSLNNIVKTTAVNTDKSAINWVGKKVIGQHHGKVKLQSGNVYTKGDILTGGNFVIDMRSIMNEDIKDVDYNKKLVAQLKSQDFFNVQEYPTASLKITKVAKVVSKQNEYTLDGDLTIKGITKNISFPATFKADGKGYKGNANITIDRTLWDIKYGSSSFFEGLGDKAIKNEIELVVKIASY